MKNRPIVNHITFLLNGKWVNRGFLPFYDKQLLWAEDVKCHTNITPCTLACHCHPMVQDEHNENMYHKLCTLTAIKAKLVTMKEISGS